MTTATHRLLAGDVGGTKTHLAIFSSEGTALTMERNRRYRTAAHDSLGAILRDFLQAEDDHLAAACLGVPGAVRNGRARPTNISWEVDGDALAEEFSIPVVAILNDLAANAHGIRELPSEDFAVIQAGEPVRGNRCVVSPGTGLGEAGLFWDGKRHRVWACEGGHTNFGPRNELEIDLLRYLAKEYGHVSEERVVSGMGIENIYRFLRDSGRGRELPGIAEEMLNGEAGAIIAAHAEAEDCSLCALTMETFLSAFGAEAGNMALKAMATGGVYLGGGIPVKLLKSLREGGFLAAFNAKGRHAPLMKSMPVKVILNDHAALLGAARYALDCLED